MEDHSTQASMENFPYPPLPLGEDAIRILTIEPSKFDDQITCTLAPVAFNAKPRYAALSYTWEDPFPDRPKCPPELPNQEESTSDGRQTLPDSQDPAPEDLAMDAIDGPGSIIVNSHQFLVKPNLFLALRHLRSSTRPLALWVDAICINQNDVEERNIHVTLMSFIYKRAAMVVAWVGPEDYAKDNPTRSMQLREIRSTCEKGRLAACLEGEYLHCERFDFPQVAESSFWTRLWVVQELCLPSRVVFAYGSKLWEYNQHELSPRYQNMDRILKVRKSRYTERMTLEYLVETFSNAACSDIRDKIYGILGLAHGVIPYAESRKGAESVGIEPAKLQEETFFDPQGREGMLKVDYAQSLYGVWTDVVKYLFYRADSIGTSRIQDALTIAQKSTLGRYFGVLEREKRYINIVSASGFFQEALGGNVEQSIATHCSKDEQQESMITAIGYLAGEILGVGPEYAALMHSCRSQQEWLYYLEGRGCIDDNIKSLGETNEKYMAKISKYSDRKLARIQDIMNPKVTAWPQSGGRVPSSDPDYIAEYKKIWEDAGDPSAQPKICVCTGNLVALVPAATRPGDVIIRFWDCSIAIVMRPYSQKRDTFMLIGRADIAKVNQKRYVFGEAINNHYTDYKERYDYEESYYYEERCDKAFTVPCEFSDFLNGLSGNRYPKQKMNTSAPGAVYVDLDFSTLQLISAPM
ncbi:heterokaryon incompatibility protein-domain-containing protein [Hypoxylon sp. FL0890]|nr:heterokaryon incompatibility protein-domain-containing protein [Hypoxylon sp. FL0890]